MSEKVLSVTVYLYQLWLLKLLLGTSNTRVLVAQQVVHLALMMEDQKAVGFILNPGGWIHFIWLLAERINVTSC